MTRTTHRCQFIPPYLMERVQPHKMELDRSFRSAREAGPRPAPESAASSGKAWVVHTCNNTTQLPGTVVRSAGDPKSGDAAVDEAADGITATLAFYADAYGRDSYDDKGASVSLSVHYDKDYDNAYWDGTQLVFGDGDGKIFDRFTKPIDVLGHEFTHAVTERTAGLTYSGQSGALNESVSDVFGSCVKQRQLGQTADQADWLIGEGLFLPGIQGRALRDMKNPGTAYDDPQLGKDPQVGDMSDYVDTTDDNGGVHTNSGIPNRAFALAAIAIGGDSWEGAGKIWYAALTGGQVTANTDFAGFAAATVAAAGDHADDVRTAWTTVGVTPGGSGSGSGNGSSSTPAGTRVAVRRSGGFAGRTTEADVDLSTEDERASELRDLVSRVDVAAMSQPENPKPDMFVYDFDLCGSTCRVPEQHLTPELRRIAELVLR